MLYWADIHISMFTDRKNNRFQTKWIMQKRNKWIFNTAPSPIITARRLMLLTRITAYRALSRLYIHIFYAWCTQRVNAIYISHIYNLCFGYFFKLSSCHTKQIYSEIKSKRKAKFVFSLKLHGLNRRKTCSNFIQVFHIIIKCWGGVYILYTEL